MRIGNRPGDPLTSRQAQILDFIRRHISDTGRSPTLREISSAFGFSSTNATECHLKFMISKGALTKDPKIARGLRPVPVYGSETPEAVRLERDELRRRIERALEVKGTGATRAAKMAEILTEGDRESTGAS